MDGVSAAATALAIANGAWKLGVDLYQFIQATKNVDRTVGALQQEVKQLGDICNTVGDLLKSLSFNKKDDEGLLAGVDTQLGDCRQVISLLDQALHSVKENKRSFFKQSIRQKKLELSQSEIDKCRQRVHINITNLQLSLQLLNLKATFLAPQVANESLLHELTDLRRAVESNGQKLDKSLLRCVDGYVSQGTTLYAQSVASASVLGALPNSKATAISDWVSKLNALRIEANPIPSALSDDAESTQPGAESSSTPLADSTDITEPDFERKDYAGSSGSGHVDEDENIATELAEAALGSGREAFAKADFVEADLMLREGVTLIETLSNTSRQQYDLEELHYKLAVCSYHTHDLPTAEAALVSVVERQSVSTVDALRKLDAGVLLAQVYIKAGKLEPARSTCESVYRGRRRLLKKDDEPCHESLALLVRTYVLLGNTGRANTYRSMIPSTKRDDCAKMFDHVAVVAQPAAISGANSAEPAHPWGQRARQARSGTGGEPAQQPLPSQLPTRTNASVKARHSGPTIHKGWGRVSTFACSWDNKLFACSLSETSFTGIAIRDADTGNLTTTLDTGKLSTTLRRQIFLHETLSIAFSEDGRYLASWHWTVKNKVATTVIWNLKTPTDSFTFSLKTSETPFGMLFDTQNPLLAAVYGKQIIIWNLDTRRVAWSTQLAGGFNYLSFSQVTDELAILYEGSNAAKTTMLLRLDTNYFQYMEEALSGSLTGLAWARDDDPGHLTVFNSQNFTFNDLSTINVITPIYPSVKPPDFLPSNRRLCSCDFMLDGRMTGIAFGTPAGNTRSMDWAIADPEAGKWHPLKRALHPSGDLNDISWTYISPDASLLILQLHSGDWHVWDTVELFQRLRVS